MKLEHSRSKNALQFQPSLYIPVCTSDVSEVVQNGAKRFVLITILAGYKLCSCSLGRLEGTEIYLFKTIFDSGPPGDSAVKIIDEELELDQIV